MNTIRAWFTPGSVALAMLVALLWLHRLHLSLVGRKFGQAVVVCLAFAALWVLTSGEHPRS